MVLQTIQSGRKLLNKADFRIKNLLQLLHLLHRLLDLLLCLALFQGLHVELEPPLEESDGVAEHAPVEVLLQKLLNKHRQRNLLQILPLTPQQLLRPRHYRCFILTLLLRRLRLNRLDLLGPHLPKLTVIPFLGIASPNKSHLNEQKLLVRLHDAALHFQLLAVLPNYWLEYGPGPLLVAVDHGGGLLGEDPAAVILVEVLKILDIPVLPVLELTIIYGLLIHFLNHPVTHLVLPEIKLQPSNTEALVGLASATQLFLLEPEREVPDADNAPDDGDKLLALSLEGLCFNIFLKDPFSVEPELIPLDLSVQEVLPLFKQIAFVPILDLLCAHLLQFLSRGEQNLHLFQIVMYLLFILLDYASLHAPLILKHIKIQRYLWLCLATETTRLGPPLLPQLLLEIVHALDHEACEFLVAHGAHQVLVKLGVALVAATIGAETKGLGVGLLGLSTHHLLLLRLLNLVILHMQSHAGTRDRRQRDVEVRRVEGALGRGRLLDEHFFGLTDSQGVGLVGWLLFFEGAEESEIFVWSLHFLLLRNLRSHHIRLLFLKQTHLRPLRND